jgi:hypothetical protein
MTNTPRANLPELAAAQAQKHVTHNDALLELDALICCRILDRDLSADPASPADGDAYIVKATGTGAWTGKDGDIAYCVDGAWRFYAPFAGLTAYIADDAEFLIYNGSAWADLATVLSLENLPMLGVNTTADSTNKLAVKSAAILFDNIGNGVQTKLNKHAAGDTASFLYQTNYSGRAEIGTAGDDHFHFKVSPDGSTWYEAINIDNTTGNVGIGAAASSSRALQIGTGTPITAAYGLQFGSDASANLYRSNTGILKCDGYLYGATGLVSGGHVETPAVYPASGTNLTLETRPGTSTNSVIIASNGSTPTETMRCNSAGHVLIGTTTDNGHLTVAGKVMPEADNTRDIGSASFRFANGYFGGTVRSGSYTVGTLPSAATAGAGARAFVTDATATTFASVVAGGGANKVPVVSDGTSWIIG